MNESKKDKEKLLNEIVEQDSIKELPVLIKEDSFELNKKSIVKDLLSQLMKQQSILFMLTIFIILAFIAIFSFASYALLIGDDFSVKLSTSNIYRTLLVGFVPLLTLLLFLVRMRDGINERINQLLAIQLSENEVILSSLIPSSESKIFGKKTNLDLIKEKSSDWVINQLKDDNYIYAFPKDYNKVAKDLEERLKKYDYELKILKY